MQQWRHKKSIVTKTRRDVKVGVILWIRAEEPNAALRDLARNTRENDSNEPAAAEHPITSRRDAPEIAASRENETLVVDEHEANQENEKRSEKVDVIIIRRAENEIVVRHERERIIIDDLAVNPENEAGFTMEEVGHPVGTRRLVTIPTIVGTRSQDGRIEVMKRSKQQRMARTKMPRYGANTARAIRLNGLKKKNPRGASRVSWDL